MAVPAVTARAVAKTYAGLFDRNPVVALGGVDLVVERGTAVGLIGPNGAGKTTFVKLLLGVVRPSGGSVSVLGGPPDDPRVRARVGYLPERLYLPPKWRAAEYLASVARLKDLRDAAVEIKKRLSRVGLAGVEQRIETYSKGMRQRLGLAAALLGSPDLLVLDEPTDGVDPIGRVEVRTILLEELERGATLLLNSHLLSETERICDRVAILSGGTLRREGPLDELCGASNAFRVRFEGNLGATRARLDALGFADGEEEGGYRWAGGDLARLNECLDEVRKEGLLVAELRPDLRTLEEVLSDAVRPSGGA